MKRLIIDPAEAVCCPLRVYFGPLLYSSHRFHIVFMLVGGGGDGDGGDGGLKAGRY